MLSEEQMYHAKVFIRSYADAFACLQEAARKEATFQHYKSFYLKLNKSSEAQELVLDEEKVQAGKAFEQGYFNRLFNFSRKEVSRYLHTNPTTEEELTLQFDFMANDLRRRLDEAKKAH